MPTSRASTTYLHKPVSRASTTYLHMQPYLVMVTLMPSLDSACGGEGVGLQTAEGTRFVSHCRLPAPPGLLHELRRVTSSLRVALE